MLLITILAVRPKNVSSVPWQIQLWSAPTVSIIILLTNHVFPVQMLSPIRVAYAKIIIMTIRLIFAMLVLKQLVKITVTSYVLIICL